MTKQKKLNPKKVNKIVAECVNTANMMNFMNVKNQNQKPSMFKDEAHYEQLLDDETKEFRKIMTPTVRKSIEVIIYNGNNNDGVVSAAIAYHYLKEAGKTPKLVKVPPKKLPENIEEVIKDKVVLVVDLDISKYSFNKLNSAAKKLIYIDEHEGDFDSKTALKGKIFASCVYTWKIFYPTKKVPLIVKYVGVSDSKKHADFLPLADIVVIPLGYRYVHSPYQSREKWESGEVLEEVWDLIENNKNKLWIVIGQYMQEVQENLKEQIARNAQIRNFQGFRVGVLNFNAPGLSKRVGRQIISDMKKRGQHIDFAVLWGYEYTYHVQAYRVQIIDDHQQTRINMARLAKVLGKKGGHRKGGGGHPHAGNFYWPHKQNQDIWDLFTKNYLTQKDREYIEGKRRNF